MEPAKRIGLLIIVISGMIAAMALILSDGWGNPNYPLALFGENNYFILVRDPDWAWLKPILNFFSQTRNILALLIISAAYGLCLYMSLLQPLAFLTGNAKLKEPESSSVNQQPGEREKDV